MRTPLERELLEALQDVHKFALRLAIVNGTDEEFARIRLEKAEIAIAKAEAAAKNDSEMLDRFRASEGADAITAAADAGYLSGDVYADIVMGR